MTEAARPTITSGEDVGRQDRLGAGSGQEAAESLLSLPKG